MDVLEFSEEEIQQQLELLGYRNICREKVQEFKRDLDELMRSGEWTTMVSPENSQINVSNSSPPAFTKEKVSRCSVSQSGGGFFLHPQNREQEVRVLSPQNREAAPPWGRPDPYTRFSVAPKSSQVHTGRPELIRTEPGQFRTKPGQIQTEPGQIQTEPGQEDSIQTDSFISTEGGGQRGRIKRKVLRKHRGQSLVCDESVYSEDSGASCLEDRLADLQLSPQHQSENESHSESPSSESESAFQSYTRGMSRSHSDGDIRPKPKSFIRPVLGPTGPKKTDPVAKYFQYKQLWDMFKLPGENHRKALRWEIRERLAYQPPPPKPRQVLVPSSYVVPTEKKRSSLRWEIRTDLATGGVPRVPHSYRY